MAFASLASAGALAVATPESAVAWVERYSFDDVPAGDVMATDNAYAPRGLRFDAGCGGHRIGTFGPAPFGPRSGNQALIVGDVQPACPQPQTYIAHDNLPRTIQYWVRSPATPRTLMVSDYTDPFNPIHSSATFTAGGWTRVQIVRTPSSTTNVIRLMAPDAGTYVVDDIAVSDQAPAPPPSTMIDSAPPDAGTNSSATVAFRNADPDPTFTCQLDTGPAEPCTSPWTRDGLGVGSHTLQIRATGLFGLQEPAAKVVSWAVAPPPPPPPPACPPGSDADRDGIPDGCDTVGLPGTTPPTSGVSTNVKVDAGVVFIKLPPPAGAPGSRAAARFQAGARAQAPGTAGSGYVPLKGTATVPVGSTVDARAGTITVTSATGASTGAGGTAPTASAKLSAAIFQIRQDRAKRRAGKSKKKLPPNPTALILRSPEGAIAAARCRANGSSVIRSLSAVVPKGAFEFVGAIATVTTSEKVANVRTVDRCDGTYAEVGRGVATVTSLHRKRKTSVRVKAGRAYLMKGDFLSVESRKGR